MTDPTQDLHTKPAMDINKIQAAKHQLQNQISSALLKFSEETGLAVESVDIDKAIRMGGQVSAYVVLVDVRL